MNTFSRSRLFADDELKEVIEKGAFENIDPQITQQLQALGVVVDDTAGELRRFAEMYGRRVYAPFEYEFTIIPTYDCNLNCSYCKRSDKTFSKDLLQKFKEFFSKELEKGEYENVAVRIAGGEPLLHPDILFEMLEGLSKITQEHGKKFFSGLATNGTLLTRDLLDKLTPFLNAVQVTFEGCCTYHDSIRYDSAGTFERVLTSAEMIKDAGILLNMRVHVSEESIPGLKELFDDLRSSVGLGAESKTMITAAPVVETRICPFYPLRCTETVEAASILPEAWKAAKECGMIITGIPNPPYEMLPCPYITPTSLIVDPSGTFYKCLMAANEKTCAAGSIQEGVLRSDPFNPAEFWHSKECLTCQFLPLCGGGCAWRAWKTQNEPADPCGGTHSLTAERVKFYLKNEHPVLE